MEFVIVMKPGMFTTVQDLGRRASQYLGISASGAMDPLALRLANLLVGNDEGEAVLEATVIGPRLRFEADGVIAITGGNLSPSINGNRVAMWKALSVHKDDELSFGQCESGCRAYISFAGGIAVPKVMGSRSTFIRGSYGGIQGRPIKADDRIPLGASPYKIRDITGRELALTSIPDYISERPVRFIPGAQTSSFTDESLRTFVSAPYSVTNESDRMGYRLQGQALRHIHGADIISDYIPVGSIQVPASGQPIILMADCQMTGGYTKLGVIASVDIPYVAQKKPGDFIRFQSEEVSAAQERWKQQEQLVLGLRLMNRILPMGWKMERE